MHKVVIAAAFAALCASAQTQAAGIADKYNKSCAACHNTGAAGAPKKGDKAAWAARMKLGEATLVNHVKNGYKAMPPKGLCMDCSDADFKALVKYLAN